MMTHDVVQIASNAQSFSSAHSICKKRSRCQKFSVHAREFLASLSFANGERRRRRTKQRETEVGAELEEKRHTSQAMHIKNTERRGLRKDPRHRNARTDDERGFACDHDDE